MIILCCKTSQKCKLCYGYAVCLFWKIDENYARNYAKNMLAQSIKAYPGYRVALQYIPVTCIVTVRVLHVIFIDYCLTTY